MEWWLFSIAVFQEYSRVYRGWKTLGKTYSEVQKNLDLMQGVVETLIMVQLISASGALAPGPLTITAIALGGGLRRGLRMAAGHMAVEAPLVLLLALGIATFLHNYSPIISVAGGITLLYLSYSLATGDNGARERRAVSSPFIAGAALTAFNPHFIVWWITVGLELIRRVIEASSLAILPLFYVSHVWMDFAWLGILTYSSARVEMLLKSKYYRKIILLFSVILAVLGLVFIRDGVSSLL